MSDDQIDLNKAAENREGQQKEASGCACGKHCLPRSKRMLDKTPEKSPLANPMDKVAEDLFDNE